MQTFSAFSMLAPPHRGASHFPQKRFVPLCMLLFLLCIGVQFTAQAQGNLVLNPSFETANSCPFGTADLGPLSQLSVHCANWHSANEATPDYFHACTQATCSNPPVDYLRIVGVPQNTFGHQLASSAANATQEAYAGIIHSPNPSVLSTHNRREYIEGELSAPLEKDQLYDVSFYVSLAEGSTYALTDLGAYLRQGDYVQGDMYTINVIPQVRDNSRFFTDMGNWVEIRGQYRAQGGEDHIIIGYFRNTLSATIDYQVVTSAYTSCYSQGAPAAYAGYAYYYIDDVSVSLACRCGRNGYTVALVPDSTRPANSTECCYHIELTREAGACDIGGVRLSMLPDSNTTPNAFSQVYGGATPWTLANGAANNPAWSRNILAPWQPTETIGGVCVTAKETPRYLVIEYLDSAMTHMCADTIPMPECNPATCCDSLQATLFAFPDVTSGTCCYSILSQLSDACSSIVSLRVSSLSSALMFQTADPARTPVSSITFNKFTINGSPFVGGELCMIAGSAPSYPVRLEYLDSESAVVCTSDTTLDCQCHCGVEFYAPRLDPVYNTHDSECCWTLTLNPRYGACPLYGVTAEIFNSNGSAQVLNVPALPSAPLLANDSITLAQFCMASTDLTGQEKLRVCYFGESGLLCCDTLSIRCLDCCEKFHLVPVSVPTPSDVDPESCCKNVYITRDSGSTCDIYEVQVLNAMGGIPKQPNPISFLSTNVPLPPLGAQISYCLAPGEKRTVTVLFLDGEGNVVCSRILTDSCAERQCCDSISLGFEYPISFPGNPPDSCCASIYAVQSAQSSCKIYGVRVTGADGGIPFDSTQAITFPGCGTCTHRTVASYCLGPGESRTIVIEFLDNTGMTLCTKQLELSCPPVDSCCDKLKVEVVDSVEYSNSCCKQIVLSRLPGLNCAVYGVRLTGQGAQGGIPLQSTPIAFPAYNPFAPSTLVLGRVCAPLGVSRVVTIEYLDSNNAVLCTKTVTVTCDYHKQGSSAEKRSSPFHLQVLPNPTSGNTAISYTLATDEVVKVELYNPQGMLVATPEQGMRGAGEHVVNYSTNGLAAGVYYLKLTVGSHTTSLPLVVEKP